MTQALIVLAGYVCYRKYDATLRGDPFWWEDVAVRGSFIFLTTYLLRLFT